jgi:hypothetical protein
LSKQTTPLAVVTLMFTITAAADAPHFVTGPFGQVDSNSGNYTVTFKEARLGNTPVTYTPSTASESFQFQCFTKSNNKPQGTPNSVSFSNASTQTTLTPSNGQTTGSRTRLMIEDGASCQGGGLKLCLTAVSYQTVTFSDGANTVELPSASVPLTKPVCVD